MIFSPRHDFQPTEEPPFRPRVEGTRGRAPVAVRTAAEAAAALSRVAAAHPEIAEIEINPLLVTPGGAVGLDARVVLA